MTQNVVTKMHNGSAITLIAYLIEEWFFKIFFKSQMFQQEDHSTLKQNYLFISMEKNSG